jgi:hypothetical protein
VFKASDSAGYVTQRRSEYDVRVEECETTKIRDSDEQKSQPIQGRAKASGLRADKMEGTSEKERLVISYYLRVLCALLFSSFHFGIYGVLTLISRIDP